jgi:hypothetical protein
MTLARAVLLAVLALGCGGPPAPAPPTATPAATAGLSDSCATADDCVLVDACCGCSSGGSRLAIRKDAAAAFEASRPTRCGDRMCAQVISSDPSCDAEPICGSRDRCRVAPHMQHQ